MWHQLKVLFLFWLIACAGGLIYKHLIISQPSSIFERVAEVERMKVLPKPVKDIEAKSGIPTLEQVLYETERRVNNEPIPSFIREWEVEGYLKTNKLEQLGHAEKNYKQKYKTATIRFFEDYAVIMLVVTFIATILLFFTHIMLGFLFMSAVSWFSLHALNNYVELDGLFFSLTWFPAMVVAGAWLIPLVVLFFMLLGGAPKAIGATASASTGLIAGGVDFAQNNSIFTGLVGAKLLPTFGKFAEKHSTIAGLATAAIIEKTKK